MRLHNCKVFFKINLSDFLARYIFYIKPISRDNVPTLEPIEPKDVKNIKKTPLSLSVFQLPTNIFTGSCFAFIHFNRNNLYHKHRLYSRLVKYKASFVYPKIDYGLFVVKIEVWNSRVSIVAMFISPGAVLNVF